MYISDNQAIAICQDGKPVGLVRGFKSKPRSLGGEIAIVGWRGEFLGEEIAEQSPNEVYRRAREIAKAKGYSRVSLYDGTGVVALHEPTMLPRRI